MSRTAPTAKRVTKAELQRGAMQAYAEWLHMELRLLNMELMPDYPYRDKFSCCNTAAHGFHLPTGKKWNAPSSRALPMMRALGIDVAKHIRRDKREGVVWPAVPTARKRRAQDSASKQFTVNQPKG